MQYFRLWERLFFHSVGGEVRRLKKCYPTSLLVFGGVTDARDKTNSNITVQKRAGLHQCGRSVFITITMKLDSTSSLQVPVMLISPARSMAVLDSRRCDPYGGLANFI